MVSCNNFQKRCLKFKYNLPFLGKYNIASQFFLTSLSVKTKLLHYVLEFRKVLVQLDAPVVKKT